MGEEVRKGTEIDEEEVRELIAMPEEERIVYCEGVIRAVANTLDEIMKTKAKIPQAKAMKEFMKDFKEKRAKILPVFFYAIKPEFRDVFLDLLDKLGGGQT